MNNGQRTVAGMLAVVAVLLGLNLIVRGSPTAVAAPRPPEPKVVHATVEFGSGCGVSNFNERSYTRFWDDGTIDITTLCVSNRDCLPLEGGVLSCGPTIIVSGF